MLLIGVPTADGSDSPSFLLSTMLRPGRGKDIPKSANALLLVADILRFCTGAATPIWIFNP